MKNRKLYELPKPASLCNLCVFTSQYNYTAINVTLVEKRYRGDMIMESILHALPINRYVELPSKLALVCVDK